MNPELQLLIERVARIYFWLFIIVFIIQTLYMYTDEYKRIKEIQEKFGKVQNGFTLTNVFSWLLFILSTYYK